MDLIADLIYQIDRLDSAIKHKKNMTFISRSFIFVQLAPWVGIGHRFFLLRKNPRHPASLASGSPTNLYSFSRLISKLQSGFLTRYPIGKRKSTSLRWHSFFCCSVGRDRTYDQAITFCLKLLSVWTISSSFILRLLVCHIGGCKALRNMNLNSPHHYSPKG